MTSALLSLEDFANDAQELQVRARMGRPLEKPRTEMAQWIIDVRLHAGFNSQEAFAEEMRVNRTTVADWERGANLPEGLHVLAMVKLHSTLPLPGQHFSRNDTAESATIAAFIAPLPERHRMQVKNDVREIVKRMLKGLKSSK